MITSYLQLLTIPIIVYTDLYSLYDYLVRLSTTKEKRLIIDIIALRQLYKRRELYKVRQINGLDNLVDVMTKGSCNKALEKLLDSNCLAIRAEGWVKRGEKDREEGEGETIM